MDRIPEFTYTFNGNNTFSSEIDEKSLIENNWVITERRKRKCIFSSTLPEELEMYRDDLVVEQKRQVIVIYIYIPMVKYIYNGNKTRRMVILPPFIMKYKQYSVIDIQNGIEKAESTLSDESTVRRWKKIGIDKRKDIETSFYSFMEHNDKLFEIKYTLSSFYSHLKDLYPSLYLCYLIEILIIENYHFP